MLIRFFSLILLFSAFTNHAESASIIHLKGTSCAGKTTLVNFLSEKLKDLEIIDEDALVIEAYPKAVAEKFPDEYACITKAVAEINMYHALRLKDVLFKKTATQEECIEAERSLCAIQTQLNQSLNWKQSVSAGITQEIINRLTLLYEEDKNVLIDAWYLTADQIQHLFPEANILRVLLYCPFSIAYERLIKRNAESIALEDLRQKRLISQLMGSFCSLYKISEGDEPSIESVCKCELNAIFDAIALILPEKGEPKLVFTYGEMSQDQFKKLQSDFLQSFADFEKPHISPKDRYDLIIDNTFGNLKKALKALFEML